MAKEISTPKVADEVDRTDNQSLVIFLAVLAGAVAFIWLTARALPAQIASHFDSSGLPNGFSSHSSYLNGMLAFVILMPSVILAVSYLTTQSVDLLNVPNKEYWCSAERQDQTLSFLRTSLQWLAIGIVVFLCYVHWLIVLTNRTPPHILLKPWLIGGLVVYFSGIICWIIGLIAHFRVPTNATTYRP